MTVYVGVAGASQPEASLIAPAETLGRRLAEAGAVRLLDQLLADLAAAAAATAAVPGRAS